MQRHHRDSLERSRQSLGNFRTPPLLTEWKMILTLVAAAGLLARTANPRNWRGTVSADSVSSFRSSG